MKNQSIPTFTGHEYMCLMSNCLRILLIATLMILQGCGSDPSDLELIGQAKNLLNKRDYAGAIFLLEDISEKTEDVVVLTAEAYAGRGGFEVIPVLKNLIEAKSSNELDLILDLSSSATSFGKSSTKKALELIEPIIATTSGKTELKYALFQFFYSSIILRNNYREDSCVKVPVSELNELLVSLTKGITSFVSAVKKAKIAKLDSIAKNLLELREAINPDKMDYSKSSLNEEEEAALRFFLEEGLLGEEKCEYKKAKIAKLDSIAKNLLESREAINPDEMDYLKSSLNEEEEAALGFFLEEGLL